VIPHEAAVCARLLTATGETIRGVRCRRYDAFADFHHARQTDPALAAPLRADGQDLSKLPIQVWVDSAGLIREALYWREDDWQTHMQLSDHGVPNSVEIPNEHELAPDD
jgi:hypothetical protein